MKIPELFYSLKHELHLPAPHENIFLSECQKEITFIRDDLIHNIISGNKWRKLNKHLDYFFENNFSGVTSIGGAYSNHLHALSYVCYRLHVPCQILVYGLQDTATTMTMQDCMRWNAEIKPIKRELAKQIRLAESLDQSVLQQNYYWIPEGGGGIRGINGVKDILNELPQIDQKENLILCACGTGTTVQGLLEGSSAIRIVTQRTVNSGIYHWEDHPRISWLPADKISFGKVNQQLIEFINRFNQQYGILLDPVYTSRLLLAFLTNYENYNFSKLYFLHTGGLQANRGI
jgi:1-aminocyclopropane-1-carboxylate deaminase